MASNVAAQVTALVKTGVRETFTPAIMKAAIAAGAAQAIREFQDRTVDGYGSDGGKLRRLRPGTIKRKERIMRKRRPSGRFAMEAPTNVARETGQTLRDMQATGARAARTSDGVSGGFEISFKTQRSLKVAKNLESQGRSIVGFSPENTARGRAERRRVLGVMAAVLKTSARGAGIITDRPI